MNIIKVVIMLCIGTISINQIVVAKPAKRSVKSVATEQAKADEQVMQSAKQYEQQGEYAKAIDIYQYEIARGSLPAMDALGVLYLNGKGFEKKDFEKAFEQFQKAAEKGYPPAQKNLGTMYLLGHGVKKDYHQAMHWFKQAAEKGNAEAQYNYGVGYLNGKGLRQDKKLAKQWFGKACDNGHQKGCNAYKKLNEQGF